MDPHASKPPLGPRAEKTPSPPTLRRTVRKSALLNAAIILTSLPVLVSVGGPRAILPALAIMAMISLLIWSSTFALFSFVSLARIFWAEGHSPAAHGGKPSGSRSGVADRWLDGPV